MNTSKHPKLDDPFEEDWDNEFDEDWKYDDPPPCEHCGGEYGEHKYGCHLLKAIAKAIEKDKQK